MCHERDEAWKRRAASITADMIGNPVAKAAAWCRAEPGDLYAATRVARWLATARICLVCLW
jgi:hypothetical protein